MDNDEKYNYLSRSDYQFSDNISKDIFCIIRFELGEYVMDRYDELMDEFASSVTLSNQTYYDNKTSILRRIKTYLRDRKIEDLQVFLKSKQQSIKDGFMQPKEAKNLSVTLDILDSIAKKILQLDYNITQELSYGTLKKTGDAYDIIDNYFEKGLDKKHSNVLDFIVECYEYIVKSIDLAYGGINYGKKY